MTVDQAFQRGICRRFMGAVENREWADWEFVIGREVAGRIVVVTPDKSVLRCVGFSCETGNNRSSKRKKWDGSFLFGVYGIRSCATVQKRNG